jgi:hypothetical protein
MIQQAVSTLTSCAKLSNPVNKNNEVKRLSPVREIFVQSIAAARDETADSVIAMQHKPSRKPGKGLPVSFRAGIKGPQAFKKISRSAFF